MGERYIQVWAPDNGRVPFPSIITIWGGGTLWGISWRWGTAFLVSHYTLTTKIIIHFNNDEHQTTPLRRLRDSSIV